MRGFARQLGRAFFLFHASKTCVKVEIVMASIVGTIPKPVRLVEGVFKVGDSRVSLDSVVYSFNDGNGAAEIQHQYDSLSLAQVHAAIAYYLHNKEKVDAYIVAHEKEREKFWREHEAEIPPKITREMLLARKNGEDPNWPR